ncbi:P-type conjugative transfer protein TrbL [Duganella sp. FT94W]|uniref:P-type conjugative transfer protein TrbL n=2 Tax=Duganella lactea TaxID=2692173 RepID=A0ABW9V0J6_9BURK|nr:P-type conjugative transfer protein TrbL [Duganella lactea]MYM33274.1 P-type conjugative transfer protein TrbL [Duganella lactea]
MNANAEIETDGIFDKVHDVYFTAATSWASVIKLHASRLFWTLALISMVWTFGMLALRNSDAGEFFAEFVRFTIFTGFYWWLLDNGPTMAKAIIDSMRTMGGSASAGTHSSAYPLPSPSSIVDIGFSIFAKVISESSVWSPFASIVGAFLSIAILAILTLIAVNVLIVLISAWVLAYAGIFFLGFGGCRWTSEMAISYFKTVLGIAVQLLVMILLVGVGKTFIDLYYSRMTAGMLLTEMAAFTVSRRGR